MEWSERLYDGWISGQFAVRIKRLALVLLLFAAGMLWVREKVPDRAAVSVHTDAFVHRDESTALAEPDLREVNGSANVSYMEDKAALPVPSVSDGSEKTVLPVPVLPAVSESREEISLAVPEVPEIPEPVLPVVPDSPVDAVPGGTVADDGADEGTVPGDAEEVLPIVPDGSVDMVPDDGVADDTIPGGAEEVLPIIPDGTEEIAPTDPDIPVNPDIPVDPDVPADDGTAAPPENIPGTAGGFYVDSAGMITGIADPSAVRDGYLELPSEGCSGIASGAFLNAPAGIREIYIPENIVTIEAGAFLGLDEMEWYEKTPSGGMYTQDGVLFSEGGTCILAFPPARIGSYKVPVQVTRFAADAFAGSRSEALDAEECGAIDTGNLPSHIKLITGI